MTNIPPQQIFPPVAKDQPIGTTEHDSSSQAYVAALIVVTAGLLGLALIIAAVIEASVRPYAMTIVGGITTGLFAQLNAPQGLGAMFASLSKSLAAHK